MSNNDIKGKFFKESFKGFNKEDVIAFIDRMNKEHNSIDEAFERQIKNLKQDLIKSSEVNQRLTSELDNSTKIISDLENQIKEQTGDVVSQNISQMDYDEKREFERIQIENAQLREKFEKINVGGGNDNSNIDKSLREFIDNSLNKFTDDEREKLELKYIIKKFEEKSGLKVSDVYANDVSEITNFDFVAGNKAENNDNEKEKEREVYESLIQELQQKNVLMKEEIEKLLRINDSLDATVKNFEMNLGNKSIQINIAGDVDEATRLKAYETIMSSLGKIILSTEKEAEEVLTKAKKESEEVISKSNAEAENTIAQAKKESERIMHETESKHKNTMKRNEDIIAKIRSRHDKLLLEYSLLKDKIENSYSDFYASLNKFGGNIKEWEDNLNE